MNKYDTYLEKMTKELENKRIEIEYSKHPSRQINKMRDFYTKGTRLDNYFSHYRDKGTGREIITIFYELKKNTSENIIHNKKKAK